MRSNKKQEILNLLQNGYRFDNFYNVESTAILSDPNMKPEKKNCFAAVFVKEGTNLKMFVEIKKEEESEVLELID